MSQIIVDMEQLRLSISSIRKCADDKEMSKSAKKLGEIISGKESVGDSAEQLAEINNNIVMLVESIELLAQNVIAYLQNVADTMQNSDDATANVIASTIKNAM